MPNVSTACIQTRRVIQATCGQECIDWAISLLEAGHDSHYLRLLIGMSPPFNHFEVANYRDGLLDALGVNSIDPETCVSNYCAELMQSVLNKERDVFETVKEIAGLCLQCGYQHDIFCFYSLWCAYEDLQVSEMQWYWEEATLENIESIILAEMNRYVESRNNGSGERPA